MPVGLPGSQLEGSSCCSTSGSGIEQQKRCLYTPHSDIAALEVSANFGLSGSLEKILQPELAFLGAFLAGMLIFCVARCAK